MGVMQVKLIDHTKYVCKYGLYHDKPCVDNEPSSNNGWIYTAYAKALGLKTGNYFYLYNSCFSDRGNFIINRLPKKTKPPISRDEIIGMVSLKTTIDDVLWYSDFNMYRLNLKNVSYFDSLKALWIIRNEHRNYMWENKIYPAYKLAFKLMPHDVYYIKKYNRVKQSFFEWGMFQLYAFSTILQNNVSAKNVLWLQLKDLNSIFWIKFLNQKKNFLEYFGKEHVFNRDNTH